MNRSMFGRKTSQSQLQRPRVDRFMPPRETFIDQHWRRSLLPYADDETFEIWEEKHQKQKNYRRYLNEAFGLEPLKSLEFRSASESYGLQAAAWPCLPRRRGYLSSAESILDLPSYSYAPFPEHMDWSSSNMLVAALGTSYHVFSWKDQKVAGEGITQGDIHCCKFNPTENILAIGSDAQLIELHDSMLRRQLSLHRCRCPYISTQDVCIVSAVDWSPTGDFFVTGCSRGLVTGFDRRRAVGFSSIRLLRGPILAVRISPNARYVAAVGLNSHVVHVMTWPSLIHHSSFESPCTVKTIAWHPWRSALLGIGKMYAGFEISITMWDTPSSRIRETELRLDHHCLESMLFSHRTGELVISLWCPEFQGHSQLLVMSDADTVQDQSGPDKNWFFRVRTMVFSPDGTKLATATADEDLIIWNFLPEDKKNNRNKARRFSALPKYLDKVTLGYVAR